MAILTSAFAYLGSYYHEANPSLQGSVVFVFKSVLNVDNILGQNLFTKGDPEGLAIMDKQIYRLIGKATTLAAYVQCRLFVFITVLSRYFMHSMAYRIRQGRDFVIPPTGLSYTGS
jgi:citrate synthase